ncbi:hypothetical protein AB0A72_41470 [Streptosporangium roseum]
MSSCCLCIDGRPAGGTVPTARGLAIGWWCSLAQRRGFRDLAGLLLPRDRNKTLTALAGARNAAVQRLQFFLTESPWEPMELWQLDIMGGEMLADGRELKLIIRQPNELLLIQCPALDQVFQLPLTSHVRTLSPDLHRRLEERCFGNRVTTDWYARAVIIA